MKTVACIVQPGFAPFEFGRDDAEIEVRDAVVGAVEPERLARETELERGEPGQHNAGDGLHGRNRTIMRSSATFGGMLPCVAFLP